jgi:hypothetical protein
VAMIGDGVTDMEARTHAVMTGWRWDRSGCGQTDRGVPIDGWCGLPRLHVGPLYRLWRQRGAREGRSLRVWYPNTAPYLTR